jgi:hypothetical protein
LIVLLFAIDMLYPALFCSSTDQMNGGADAVPEDEIARDIEAGKDEGVTRKDLREGYLA